MRPSRAGRAPSACTTPGFLLQSINPYEQPTGGFSTRRHDAIGLGSITLLVRTEYCYRPPAWSTSASVRSVSNRKPVICAAWCHWSGRTGRRGGKSPHKLDVMHNAVHTTTKPHMVSSGQEARIDFALVCPFKTTSQLFGMIYFNLSPNARIVFTPPPPATKAKRTSTVFFFHTLLFYIIGFPIFLKIFLSSFYFLPFFLSHLPPPLTLLMALADNPALSNTIQNPSLKIMYMKKHILQMYRGSSSISSVSHLSSHTWRLNTLTRSSLPPARCSGRCPGKKKPAHSFVQANQEPATTARPPGLVAKCIQTKTDQV